MLSLYLTVSEIKRATGTLCALCNQDPLACVVKENHNCGMAMKQ